MPLRTSSPVRAELVEPKATDGQPLSFFSTDLTAEKRPFDKLRASGVVLEASNS